MESGEIKSDRLPVTQIVALENSATGERTWFARISQTESYCLKYKMAPVKAQVESDRDYAHAIHTYIGDRLYSKYKELIMWIR